MLLLSPNTSSCAGQSSKSQAALPSVKLTAPPAWHGYWCCPRVSLNDLPLGCKCGLYREYPVLARKSAPGEICPCLGVLEMMEGVLSPRP